MRTPSPRGRERAEAFLGVASLRDRATLGDREALALAFDQQEFDLLSWTPDDRPAPEDDEIDACGPWNPGSSKEDHARYSQAMRLVGFKRSKGALVDLVHWLLWRSERAVKSTLKCADAPLQSRVDEYEVLVPKGEWVEEEGDVLWWRVPVVEPPCYIGSPLDIHWADYDEDVTHFTRFPKSPRDPK